MVKVFLATLVFTASCFYSITALPSPPQGLDEYADSNEHLAKRIKFGTGLGHKTKSPKAKYITDQNNAYNKHYGDEQESDKRNFKFGTALGHKSKQNNDKYIQSQNAMYDKLFGKRDSVAQDDKDPQISLDDYADSRRRGVVAFGTALGYKKKDKYVADLNKAYKAIYGRR